MKKKFYCSQCNNEILLWPSEAEYKDHFCSRKCYYQFLKHKAVTKAICLQCGKKFVGYRRNRKYCSLTCTQKHYEYLKNRPCSYCNNPSGKKSISKDGILYCWKCFRYFEYYGFDKSMVDARSLLRRFLKMKNRKWHQYQLTERGGREHGN